ncbi:MAG: hypothetical protein JSU73_00275, partial [candidate division WOR-3 bacterium]
MKTPAVIVCLAVAVSVGQADSLYCRQIGRCIVMGMACDAALAGSFVYVANHSRGLCIVNASNPESPFIAGNCT